MAVGIAAQLCGVEKRWSLINLWWAAGEMVILRERYRDALGIIQVFKLAKMLELA